MAIVKKYNQLCANWEQGMTGGGYEELNGYFWWFFKVGHARVVNLNKKHQKYNFLNRGGSCFGRLARHGNIGQTTRHIFWNSWKKKTRKKILFWLQNFKKT